MEKERGTINGHGQGEDGGGWGVGEGKEKDTPLQGKYPQIYTICHVFQREIFPPATRNLLLMYKAVKDLL